jgi:hypothetical protein
VQPVSKRLLSVLILTVWLTLTACGTREAKLLDTYVPPPGTRIAVGEVVNATGQLPTVDEKVVNIEQMLGDALVERLREDDLLWSAESAHKLGLHCRIVEYEPGDAFKRWLMPGWGSTVLAVDCELRNEDAPVGTVRARQVVSFGGVYTIGAWRTIFGGVASAVVAELRAKLSKP